MIKDLSDWPVLGRACHFGPSIGLDDNIKSAKSCTLYRHQRYCFFRLLECLFNVHTYKIVNRTVYIEYEDPLFQLALFNEKSDACARGLSVLSGKNRNAIRDSRCAVQSLHKIKAGLGHI